MAVLVAPTTARRKRAPATLRCCTCAECVAAGHDGLRHTRRCDLTGADVTSADRSGERPAFCPLALPEGRAGRMAAETVQRLAKARGKSWRLRMYEDGRLRVGGETA